MANMPIFLQACPTAKIYLIHGPKSDVLNLNVMADNFGISNCQMLLFLHAFSGCDYTPSFFGIGKTKFFDEMVKKYEFLSSNLYRT